MLIKIVRNNDHPRNFTLFDKAERVTAFCPVHFTNSEELYDWLKDRSEYANQPDFLEIEQGNRNSLFPAGKTYVAAKLRFYRGDELYELFFDGTVYICDDSGKTLEVVQAGGLYEDKPDTPNQARHAA